jgi:hypothetical protein
MVFVKDLRSLLVVELDDVLLLLLLLLLLEVVFGMLELDAGEATGCSEVGMFRTEAATSGRGGGELASGGVGEDEGDKVGTGEVAGENLGVAVAELGTEVGGELEPSERRGEGVLDFVLSWMNVDEGGRA